MNRRDLIILIATGLILASCGPEPTPITIVETLEVEVTREVTRQVTQVVVITATPEPPPTATPEPESIFEDDFEAGEGEWFLEEVPESSVYVSDGRLVMEINSEFWNAYSDHPDFLLLDDYVLEVDISYLSGPTDSQAGIAFRCNDEDDEFLQVSIDANGFFQVARVPPDDFLDVVPWALSATIERGQAVNRLRLIDDDRRVTVFINDELVTTFPYDAVRPGCPAFFTGTFEEVGAVWAFDNITVREIGP
ncbi:MAG: hypothetical protein IIA89_06655 [Chloroflexi bacterium]|nr:hypothetical protein [Chloroflexota bacterium]